MNSRFATPFLKLEKAKSEVINSVEGLAPHQYTKSINGKWSVAQILTHILTSEQMALGYMRKKSLGIDHLLNSSWLEPSKLLVLQISQRLPLRYKVPKSILEKTPDAMPFNVLSVEWAKTRADLKAFLESIPEVHSQKKIFKHPIAGMFNAAQGLVFLREHILHHVPQIKRYL